MQADWYVDPLGRYQGRYFDGVQWTDQVSDGGVLAVDPDWPTVGVTKPAYAESDASVADGNLQTHEVEVETEVEFQPEVGTATVEAEPAAPVGASAAAPDAIWQQPASAASLPAGGLSFPGIDREPGLVESPMTQVATLPADGAAPAAPEGEFWEASEVAAETPRRTSRVLYALGLAALLAGLLIFLIPRLFGGSADVADNVDEGIAAATDLEAADTGQSAEATDQGTDATSASDDEPAAPVGVPVDGEANNADPATEGAAEAPAGAESDTGATAESTEGDTAPSDDTADTPAPADGPAHAINVGALTIRNGVPVLEELAAWHEGFGPESGGTLAADAGCWFAQSGQAVLQNAYCGPISRQGAVALYDMIPLTFEALPEDQIEVEPVISAANQSVELPNAVTLVDATDAFVAPAVELPETEADPDGSPEPVERGPVERGQRELPS